MHKQLIVEGRRLLVNKIIVKNNKNKVGYLVVNELNNKLVYFVDANKLTDRVYTMDLRYEVNNYLTLSNSSVLFEKDFMQRLGAIYTSYKIGGETPGRFWGWACGHAVDGYRHCCYYALGLSSVCDDYSTGNLPGKNPKLPKNDDIIQ